MLLFASLHRTERRRPSGFTLVELLVVIAVIAVLAGILFPVFAKARSRARASTALSNLKQLGTALAMYTADYDGAGQAIQNLNLMLDRPEAAGLEGTALFP